MKSSTEHFIAGEDSRKGDSLRRRKAPPAPVKLAPVESLDYEVYENEVYCAEQARRTTLRTLSYMSMKWTLCLLTGTLVSVSVFFVNYAVENIAAVKFSYTFALMRTSYLASFLVYALFNCGLVLLAACLVVFCAPAAAGSGIPDVKAYLNGVDTPGVLLGRTLISKMLGCICSVAGGLAVGKEGPFVHVGACIASLLCQGGTKKYHINWRCLNVLRNDRDRRELVTCGATAGVAAAFRAPVGGVLFALEEAASWWGNALLWKAFFTTAVVSVVVRTMFKLCTGTTCGYFGSGGFIIFEIREGQADYQLHELFPITILGMVGGLLGASFNSLSARLCTWRRDSASHHPLARITEAVAVALVTSVVTFVLPLLSSCEQCPADSMEPCPRQHVHFGSYVAFNCDEPNQYNPLATLFFNTQDNAIRSLFSSNTDHEYDVVSLTTFFLFFYGLSILTIGINVPSGLFVPCILCGATYGRLAGYVMTELYDSKDIDEGTYALLGAASFLGGAMRMTVSLCVILLELTNNLNLLPLMMLVLLVAKGVGDATGVSAVYDLHIGLKRLPVMPEKPESFLRHITAADASSPHVISFKRVMQVRELVDTLLSCNHNGFPVYEDPQPCGDPCMDSPLYGSTDALNNLSNPPKPAFAGFVMRSHLLYVLGTRRAFQEDPQPTGLSQHIAYSLESSEFSKATSTRGRRVEDLKLEPSDLEMYIDLGPYVNPSSYVVQEDMSLSKVYTLFRQLGLRHLAVVPKVTEVTGVITRKDLLTEVLEHKFPDLKDSRDVSISDAQYRGRRGRRYHRTPSMSEMHSRGYASDY